MSRAVWVAKKMHLCSLIKKVSDAYGGDDVAWLRAYANEVVDSYPDDIQIPLNCFLDLEKQLSTVKFIVSHGTRKGALS